MARRLSTPKRAKAGSVPPALRGLPRRQLESLLALNPHVRPLVERGFRRGQMTSHEVVREGGAILVTIRGLRLGITLNSAFSLGWHKVHALRKQEHATVAAALRGVEVPPPPWRVTITRRGTVPMDPDNAVAATKGVQDEIARWAMVDDGSPLWRWRWADEVAQEYGVLIRIESCEGLARADAVVTDGGGRRSE